MKSDFAPGQAKLVWECLFDVQVKQLERHVQRLTGIDPTKPRGCDQQALLTKAALDAALAAALHGTKVECSEIGHSSLDQHPWPSVT